MTAKREREGGIVTLYPSSGSHPFPLPWIRPCKINCVMIHPLDSNLFSGQNYSYFEQLGSGLSGKIACEC